MENNIVIQPKMVIVARKDLNMPSGKLSTQVRHASDCCMMNLFQKNDDGRILSFNLELDRNNKKDLAVINWINVIFTKVLLSVKSEERLINIYEKAKAKGLNTVIIEDIGLTVFNGVKTKTCVGIGPCYPEDLIGITNKLQLYKD